METTIKIMVLLVTSLMLFSCGGDDNQLLSPQDSGSPTIKTAHSNEELEAYLKTSLINNYATDITTRYEYSLASSDSSASPSSSSSTSFSVTNTQEPDVDEADRLKTDGTYLYTSSINKPEINIFETSNSSVTKIATYKLDTLNPDLSTLSGLYLRKFAQQLLALSDDGRQNFHIWDMWFVPNYWQNRKTEIFTLDVSDPSLPTQTNKVTLDGQLISSRRIGSTLYLATRHTPSIDGLITSPIDASELAKNKQLINQASISEMLPTYQFNNGSKQALFSEGDCFINDDDQASQQQSSVISLLAIDLDAVIPSPRGRCYVGDAETVYASGKALYLATTRYTYTEENGIAIYNGKPSTEIHKFSLNNTIPEYRGTGSVDGHLGWKQDLKPFRMSEHNEVLRVITYTGEQADSNHSPAHLYTLKENSESATLDILGTLPNDTRPTPLGKIGEQIYATRFVGTRAYLVTFRMTDPLYIVDLSNPADPFIASELEINGYSDYLHQIGRAHV